MNTQQLAEYLETYGPKSNIDRTALLAAAELRRLHEENERLKAQQQEQQALEEQLGDALNSFVFYRRRVEALQQWQSKMRDPERTIVCDIIANGHTLKPAGDRYKQPAQQEPVAFLANGTRFKMSFFENEDEPGTHVTCFEAFEKELDGRWVALVPAEDDSHLKLTPPAQRKPLTDEQIDRAIAELGLNYFADAANNRAVLRELCRKAAHGTTKGNT